MSTLSNNRNKNKKAIQESSFLISIIIINYKSNKPLTQCLKSIQKHVSPKILKGTEVIVVNNSRTNKKTRERFLHSSRCVSGSSRNDIIQNSTINNQTLTIKLIQNDKNFGFARAANQGAKLAKGKLLLFLNPDTYCTHDFITPLIKFYKQNKKVGLVSPQLLLPNGKPQPFAHGKNPGIWKFIFDKINMLSYSPSSLTQSETEALKGPGGGFVANCLSGTSMLISRKKFIRLKGFDKRFFMYFEDDDLCVRANKKNWENYIIPTAKLIHTGGAQIYKNKRLYYKSQIQFIHKHYSKTYTYIFKILQFIYIKLTKKSQGKILKYLPALIIVLLITTLIQFSILYTLLSFLFISGFLFFYIYLKQTWMALIFLLPFSLAIPLPNNEYIPWIRLAIPAFTLIWTFNALIRKQKISIPFNSTTFVFYILLGLAAFSIILKQGAGIRKYLLWLSLFPFYIVCYNLFQRIKNKNVVPAQAGTYASKKEKAQQKEKNYRNHPSSKIFTLILGSSIIVNLIALSQFFAQKIIGLDQLLKIYTQKLGPILWGQNLAEEAGLNNSWLVDVQGKIIMRATSLFHSLHHYAFYLGLITPLATCLLIYSLLNKKYKAGIFYTCCLILSLFCLLFTFSRGSYFSGFISLSFLLIFTFKYLSTKAKFLLITFSASLIIIIILISFPLINQRIANLFNIYEPSNFERVSILESSWDLFKTNWLTGVGFGNYTNYFGSRNLANKTIINAHNTYLELSIEMGILAPLIILILLFKPVLDFFFYVKKQGFQTQKKEPWLHLGIITALLWLSIHSFFEISLYSPIILILLMIYLAFLPKNATIKN